MGTLAIISFFLGLLLSFSEKKEVIKKCTNIYLVYFGLPFLILVSLSAERYIQWWPFISAVMIFLICLNLVAYYLLKYINLEPKKKSALFLCGTYGNFAYLGIPAGFIFFGNLGVALSALATIAGGLIHFSLGIYLSNSYVQGRFNSLKEMFKFPLLYGLIATLILSRYNISFPKDIRTFASIAIYLAIFLVGISLQFKKFEWSYIFGIFLKFLISPISALIISYLIHLSCNYRNMLLLLSLTPPALVNTVISINYKFDESLTAELTSVGTGLFILGLFLLKYHSYLI